MTVAPGSNARAAALLSVTSQGTFEHGSSTLQLRQDPDDAAWWERTRQRLLEARHARPQPGLDDKVVTSWNGLAIAGLADAGVLLDRPDLVDAVVALPDVAESGGRVHAAMHVGDAATLARVHEHTDAVRTHLAGSTCIIDADLLPAADRADRPVVT